MNLIEAVQTDDCVGFPNIKRMSLNTYETTSEKDLLTLMNKFNELEELSILAFDAAPWLSNSGIITSSLFDTFFIHVSENIPKFEFMIARAEDDILEFLHQFYKCMEKVVEKDHDHKFCLEIELLSNNEHTNEDLDDYCTALVINSSLDKKYTTITYGIDYDEYRYNPAALRNAIQTACSVSNNVLHEIQFNSVDGRRPSGEDTKEFGFVFKNITTNNRRLHKLGFINGSFNDFLKIKNYLRRHAADYQKLKQLEFQGCERILNISFCLYQRLYQI
jgi:hypothetical protein